MLMLTGCAAVAHAIRTRRASVSTAVKGEDLRDPRGVVVQVVLWVDEVGCVARAFRAGKDNVFVDLTHSQLDLIETACVPLLSSFVLVLVQNGDAVPRVVESCRAYKSSQSIERSSFCVRKRVIESDKRGMVSLLTHR